jgi:hypothetical protein
MSLRRAPDQSAISTPMRPNPSAPEPPRAILPNLQVRDREPHPIEHYARRAAALRYFSDRNKRQETPNQMATAASQTAAVRSVLPLDDAL